MKNRQGSDGNYIGATKDLENKCFIMINHPSKIDATRIVQCCLNIYMGIYTSELNPLIDRKIIKKKKKRARMSMRRQNLVDRASRRDYTQ